MLERTKKKTQKKFRKPKLRKFRFHEKRLEEAEGSDSIKDSEKIGNLKE